MRCGVCKTRLIPTGSVRRPSGTYRTYAPCRRLDDPEAHPARHKKPKPPKDAPPR